MFDDDDYANMEYKSRQERSRRTRTEWEHYDNINKRILNYKLDKDLKKSKEYYKEKGQTMNKPNFAKGIIVKKHTFDNGGFLIKMGINIENLKENIFNEQGWANFEICFAKDTGKPYCKVDDYKKTSEDTEEIPF